LQFFVEIPDRSLFAAVPCWITALLLNEGRWYRGKASSPLEQAAPQIADVKRGLQM